MTEIRHIVFDIGKVLIHYDPDLPFSRLIPDPEERKWFFENVCTGEWNLEQDRGRTWEEAEALLIELHPAHEQNIRNFRRLWHEMVPHAYEDSVAIMEALGKAEKGKGWGAGALHNDYVRQLGKLAAKPKVSKAAQKAVATKPRKAAPAKTKRK